MTILSVFFCQRPFYHLKERLSLPTPIFRTPLYKNRFRARERESTGETLTLAPAAAPAAVPALPEFPPLPFPVFFFFFCSPFPQSKPNRYACDSENVEPSGLARCLAGVGDPCLEKRRDVGEAEDWRVGS